MDIQRNKKRRILKDFILTYSPADFFRRYELFKFLMLVFLIGFLTSLTLCAFRTGMLQIKNITLTDFYDLYVCKFFVAFWVSNLQYLVLIILVYLCIRYDLLKTLFFDQIEFIIPPKALDPKASVKLAVINKYMVRIAFLHAFFISVPLLHLFNINLYAVLTPVATLFIPFIYRNVTALATTRANFLVPLTKYHFEEISFKAASGTPMCEEVKAELRKYRHIKGLTPVGADALEATAKSHSCKFKGYTDLFNQLEQMFDPHGVSTGNLAENIRLFNEIAEAINNALETVKAAENKYQIIYSDGVYIHTRETLDKHPANAVMLPGVEDMLLKDTFSEDKFVAKVTEQMKTAVMKEPHLTGFCVVLTHIYYQTGRVSKIKEIITPINDYAANLKVKVFYLVDGTQATGNIGMDPKIEESCHFYITCTHKWLLGQYAMGVMLVNAKLLKKAGTDINAQVEQNTLPSNHPEQLYSTKTWRSKNILFEPYISANIMLLDINHCGMDAVEKHNCKLAQCFVDGLYELNNVYEVVNSDCTCGIVTIRTDKAATINSVLQDDYGISGDLFGNDTATTKSNLIRFSFHYFMSERDVNKLLYALLDIAHRD